MGSWLLSWASVALAIVSASHMMGCLSSRSKPRCTQHNNKTVGFPMSHHPRGHCQGNYKDVVCISLLRNESMQEERLPH